MIRSSLFRLTGLSLALLAPSLAANAQQTVAQAAYADETTRYSSNQLDNLVGPIALYPDALLAQVLVAATFPDQVEEAARYVRSNGTNGIDDQSWDVSVKAVAHYASALNMMDDKSDWTATLGRAYANQSSDVMAAVQRMRAMAASQGNLLSNSQQNVVTEGTTYIITPAQPRVIYVPVYDPVVVYTRPIFNVGFNTRYWSFGIGFPIGGWLSYDCDWNRRTVYYNGWSDAYYEYAGGWRARSRPFIQITNVYVNPRYRTVYVNRDVYRRPVNYRNVDRYVGVHRDTYFDVRNRDDDRRYGDNRGGDNRGGNNRGGDNRGGDNRGYDRGGDNRGNDNRGGDNRYGNRGDDRNGDYPGRTAQPRERGPVATPDGYRNGSPRGGDAQGNSQRENPSRGQEPQRTPRPDVVAPTERRSEPRMEQRRADVRAEVQASPRQEQPRRVEVQQAPRQEQARPEQSRQAQPRQAQPRDNGRSSAPRGDRGNGGGNGGGDRGGERGNGRRG